VWIILRTRKIRRRDARGYLGAEFRYWWKVWRRWKRFGLPNGSGWANEPESTIRVLELFEDELDAWREEKKQENEAKTRAAEEARRRQR